MTDPVDALVLDLLEWIGASPATGRRYDEAMAVWRTSCPRLPVWEEAQLRGLVERRSAAPGGAAVVALTAGGLAHLQAARPGAAKR